MELGHIQNLEKKNCLRDKIKVIFSHRQTSAFPGRSQKGVALMITMFAVVLITYLVNELVYETGVEYLVNSKAIYRVKAQYAARSGLDISLLRVKLYSKLKTQYGKQLGSQSKILDLVWNFPLAWPIVLPKGAFDSDKKNLDEKAKESLMDASYFTTITDEGSKFDLNDLGSTSKPIADTAHKILTNMLEGLLKDEEFMKTHENYKPDELVENIKDWVDPDNVSTVRSTESELYADMNDDVAKFPPNRGFRTVDELRLVGGIDESLFNFLKDRVTVFGMRAINPNYTSKEVIMSLDVSITSDIAAAVIARRDNEDLGGPFKDGNDNCKSDFWNFVNAKGARVSTETEGTIPLKCDSVVNFRIKSVGEFNGATKEITAIVYDLNGAAQVIATSSANQANAGNPGAPPPNPPAAPAGGGGGGSPGPTSEPLPKGPPRIVYYNER